MTAALPSLEALQAAELLTPLAVRFARSRVLRSAERDPRTLHAMRMPGILTNENGNFAVFEIAGSRVGAEHRGGDPGLTRFFLRQRVGTVAAAKRRDRGKTVCARQMIALSTAAVVHDFVATVLVSHRSEAVGYLMDRGFPVNR